MSLDANKTDVTKQTADYNVHIYIVMFCYKAQLHTLYHIVC